MNYNRFMELLKHFNTTEEVLVCLYDFFINYVTYNYDQLQVVKYKRQEEPALVTINDYINNNNINCNESLRSIIIQLLDDAFMEIEGRPLSYRNKKEWFSDFDKTHTIQVNDYPPIYDRGLLRNGVCDAYLNWVAKILTELNIPCLKVIGKGTTGHGWNLVYLEDKETWVNFDMTMVRFYLDGWTRKYGEPNKWVFATIEEMFNMQPKRTINEIRDSEDNIIFKEFININNQEELTQLLSKYIKTNTTRQLK